jgi:glucose-1-phosphate cytidylyltransferase
MKVVILAGGLGSRISEESHLKPKPMIEIGSLPILVHIMKNYSFYGYNDFIICAGYKQEVIKQFFANYYLYTSDISFDFSTNTRTVLNSHTEPWKVTVVDTGLNTQTAGRLRRIQKLIGNEPFMLTYGDAVGDINIPEVVDFHNKGGKLGTISVYNFGQSKGVLDIGKDGVVKEFREKSNIDGDLINIGFMVLEPSIFNLIQSDSAILEKDVLAPLAKEKQLDAYTHHGFWQCMDTLKEKNLLEELWDSGKAPWKIWKD